MKRIAVLLSAVAVLLVVGRVNAADAPAYKFGYVNFQRTLNEVEEGKKAKALLKSEFDEKQKKLDVVQNELQKMKTDLDKQRLILSQEALKEKEDEYRKKFMELQQKLGSYKDELQVKEAKMTSEILIVIHDMIYNIGKTDGYSTILESSQDVLLYAPESADLTDRIIKEYNAMPKNKKDEIVKKTQGKAK